MTVPEPSNYLSPQKRSEKRKGIAASPHVGAIFDPFKNNKNIRHPMGRFFGSQRQPPASRLHRPSRRVRAGHALGGGHLTAGASEARADGPCQKRSEATFGESKPADFRGANGFFAGFPGVSQFPGGLSGNPKWISHGAKMVCREIQKRQETVCCPPVLCEFRADPGHIDQEWPRFKCMAWVRLFLGRVLSPKLTYANFHLHVL